MGAIFFFGGVALHSIFPWEKFPALFWTCATFALVVFWILIPSSRRKYFLYAGLFVLGVWRFDLTIPSSRDGLLPYVRESISAQGRLESASSFHGGSRVIVSVSDVRDQKIAGPGNRITVALFGRTPPQVGARVEIQCEVKSIQDSFSARNGVWTECGNPNISLREKPSPWDVPAVLSRLHDALTERIAQMFPADEATLLSGILYGDQDLSSDQRELMKRAGLMHIVAVSGSNVTIVVTLLMALVLGIGLHRRQAFWIVSVGIALFTIFVGGSSSVMRAAVMGWLALLARHVGQSPSVSRLLLLSATVLVALNPWTLGYDAGFALSFLATWGLLTWTPVIEERVTWIPERFSLREIFATTAGATIMTLPYLAWMSGRMSLAGLFTNMLALPLLPFIMLWGAFTAAWGSGIGFLIFRTPTLGLLNLLERVAHLSDLVPLLDVHVTSMDFPLMIALYAALFLIWRQSTDKTDLFTFFSTFFQKMSHEEVT